MYVVWQAFSGFYVSQMVREEGLVSAFFVSNCGGIVVSAFCALIRTYMGEGA